MTTNTLTALQFTGQINLPTTGLWSFRLTSDDGSILYIDGAIFINNDGGSPFPMTRIIVVIIMTINIMITSYRSSLCNLPSSHSASSKAADVLVVEHNDKLGCRTFGRFGARV